MASEHRHKIFFVVLVVFCVLLIDGIPSGSINYVPIMLYHRSSSTFVEVFPNGAVRVGTKSKYARLVLESIGSGILRIRGKENGLYIAMDELGRVSAIKNATNETLWYERYRLGYSLFQSHFHIRRGSDKSKFFLGFNRRGHPRKGTTTTKEKNAVRFLMSLKNVKIIASVSRKGGCG